MSSLYYQKKVSTLIGDPRIDLLAGRCSLYRKVIVNFITSYFFAFNILMKNFENLNPVMMHDLNWWITLSREYNAQITSALIIRGTHLRRPVKHNISRSSAAGNHNVLMYLIFVNHKVSMFTITNHYIFVARACVFDIKSKSANFSGLVHFVMQSGTCCPGQRFGTMFIELPQCQQCYVYDTNFVFVNYVLTSICKVDAKKYSPAFCFGKRLWQRIKFV